MSPTPISLEDLVTDPYFAWKIAYDCAVGELDAAGRHRAADEIEQRALTVATQIGREPVGAVTRTAFAEAVHVLNDLVKSLRSMT